MGGWMEIYIYNNTPNCGDMDETLEPKKRKGTCTP
jgi:hypothetical protein